MPQSTPLQSQPIRIAISGGGMAGAIVMHALLDHPNLDVHIFESAESFRETGIAIGITQNAKKALDLIGPSATQCLQRAGSVPLKAAHRYLARGPDTGKLITTNQREDGGDLSNIVQRALFLRELLADVPSSRMHASKKLTEIDRAADGSVVVHFSDGTSHECDILIGADGIRSRVRQIVLGEGDSAIHPVPAGWWFLMTLKPYEKAKAVLGKDLLDTSHHVEYQFCGDGTFWLHNVLSNGTEVQCTAAVKCDKDEALGGWKKEVTAEELKQLFGSSATPVVKAIKELVCDQPNLTAFYMWEHKHAHSYVNGPVCLMGDAAHATTPWQASGAGMSIEDALILSNVLGRATSRGEARTALRVYNQVRLQRTQQIVDSSRITGEIFTGCCTDFDMYSLTEMKAGMDHRWDFILNIDMEKHLEEAIHLMEAEVKKQE